MPDSAVAWAGALQAAATIRAAYERPGHYDPEETATFVADLAHRLIQKVEEHDPRMHAVSSLSQPKPSLPWPTPHKKKYRISAFVRTNDGQVDGWVADRFDARVLDRFFDTREEAEQAAWSAYRVPDSRECWVDWEVDEVDVDYEKKSKRRFFTQKVWFWIFYIYCLILSGIPAVVLAILMMKG